MPKPDLIRNPVRRPMVAPSILAADFARMGEACAGVLALGADMLHLDVMDGHFVPNLTMGPDMCAGLRRAFPDALLDVHLMVTDPGMYVDPFAKAGADLLTFHAEAVSGAAADELVERIKDTGMAVGMAINPGTVADAVFPHLDGVDMVLVMSVNPGYAGQAFIEDVLVKTRAIRARLRPDQRLEMDGGIGPKNAGKVREAGCDVLVAASALFGVPADQREGVIKSLRG